MSGSALVMMNDAQGRMVRNTLFRNKRSGKAKKVDDMLPIVELQPFTQKLWRRTNSFAEFYEQNYMDNAQHNVAPTAVHIDSGVESVEKLKLNIVNLNGDEVCGKHKSPHPPIYCKVTPRSQHQGFNTADDRMESTLHVIRKDNYVTPEADAWRYPGSVPEASRVDEIKLYGAKMSRVIERHPLPYLDPFRQYTTHFEQAPQTFITQAKNRGVRINKNNPREHLVSTCRSLPEVSSVYDSFDLAGSLPSIRIRHKTARPHKRSAGGLFNYGTRRNIRSIQPIRNSHHVLRETGKPVAIEQHLSKQLEHSLKITRSSRDNSMSKLPFTAPKSFTQVQVTYRGGETQGERSIRQGLQSNSVKTLERSNTQNTGPEVPDSEDSDNQDRDSGIQSPPPEEDVTRIVSIPFSDEHGDVDEPLFSKSTKAMKVTQQPDRPKSENDAERHVNNDEHCTNSPTDVEWPGSVAQNKTPMEEVDEDVVSVDIESVMRKTPGLQEYIYEQAV